MNKDDGSQTVASVELYRDEQSSRTYTGAPARFRIGSVDFGGWQIHPVATVSRDFASNDAYLVKVNYDVNLGTGAPEPIWMDAGFEFQDEGVAVLDALPRSVRSPTCASRYVLTTHLGFDAATDTCQNTPAPSSSSHANIVMPAVVPVVEVFGVGGPIIRWRHSVTQGGTGPVGSQTGWLALLVPAGCRELHVRALGGYASTAYRLKGGQAAAKPDAFTVRLPMPAERAPTVAPPPADKARADGAASLSVRLGFAVDIVGYSERSEPGQYLVQQRLDALMREIMSDIDIALDDGYVQHTGDGMNVFMPLETDISHALPALLTATAGRLAADNQRHTDRMRLRMAIDFGPVRQAATGFSGNTIVSFGRLVESSPIRKAIKDNVRTDLVVLISDWLYWSIVSHGYGGLEPGRFTRVLAVVKSFQAEAWLWTSA